jgi:uncharacterized membrane protein YccC
MTDMPDMRARYERALAEVAEIKRALAERARHVTELEQRLMRQVEDGAREGGRRARRPAVDEPTESDLARAVAAAEAEKALAQAEREHLDERERNIRRVERELAGLRVQLDEEWRRLASSGGSAPAPPQPGEPQPDTEPPPPTPLPQPPSDPDLDPAATARRRTTRRQ